VLARVREEKRRRRGFHGAENRGELGRNSGEQLAGLGSLPREMEVSTGCARERGNSWRDGGVSGGRSSSERVRPASACGGGGGNGSRAR
jgi:hypothetical protein